ncbi:alpha-L-rhamnosidase C-terminal domain-containing protein [Streptomyces sp. NPDC012623]|uniref:alpha-L-rhamnosidase C-terminal domain-containing protein n=1 Tax=unclassified Streptomyces TaxID=2593676 RepID=UPI0036BDAF00
MSSAQPRTSHKSAAPGTPATVGSAELSPDTDWRSYVRGPQQSTVRPVAVLSSDGRVVGAQALIDATGGLELVMEPGGPEPSVVLDYGQNVAGVPWAEITGVSGTPDLHLSYSESAAWTGPEGDRRGSHNDTANQDRTESTAVREPRTVTSGLPQGGLRYQRIALTSPGSLVIGDVGLRFTGFRATSEDYRGWFACSSDQLNRIWYDGAYTVQLNQLPARSLPVPWTVQDGSLLACGGHLAVLDSGADWGDVTVTFKTRVLDRAAGWIVRASQEGRHGYLFTLRATEDAQHPSFLERFAVDDGHEGRPQDNVRRYTPLGRVPVDVPLIDGAWHEVRTTLAGPLITVALDGRTLGTLDTSALPEGVPTRSTGSVGFHQAWGFKEPTERARFRHLTVTAADGRVLYEDPLDDPAALAAFSGDAVRHPDPLPVILDGGKRDRTVWSGDLLVQIPNVFCTTVAEDYVRGSIELLNGYQEANGQSAARVPPVLPPATAPQCGQTYSAVYSMHQVVNLALHHLYTGDPRLAAEQWPWTRQMLAWCRTLLDHRGLIVTGEADGLDWDWYDGPKTGAVTAYNAAYHQMLRCTADLAQALELPAQAKDLRAQADALRSAVNRHLFDAERHLYRLSDEQPAAVALDGNALAVLTGLPDEDEAVRILDALERALPDTAVGPSPFSADTGFRPHVSPYVCDMFVRALFAHHRTDRALRLIRRLWGHMADAEQHAVGTAWELLGPDGAPGFDSTTSLAHGWAAGATTALSHHVLGVRPTSAGFATWEVAPQPGDLAWARGVMPTPHGAIEVAWSRTPDGGLDVDVTVPDGTSGTVLVPLSAENARLEVTSDAPAPPHRRVSRHSPSETVAHIPISGGGCHRVSAG